MKSIATIREYKSAELVGTSFEPIPCDNMSSEYALDHLALVKTKPKLATRMMDRYRLMIGSFYKTHKVSMEDKGGLLRDLTGPDWAKLPKKGKAQEAGGFHSAPEEGTSRRQARSGPSRYSPTPEPIFYPVIPPSEPEPSVPLEASDSYVPIENSDGWRFDWYPGTSSHPIPCYDSADEEIQSFPSVVAAPAVPVPAAAIVDDNDVVINISSDEEDLFLNDTTGKDTSDMDFVPTGRPYIPQTVRKTPRQHGWTQGMYQE